MQRRVDEVQPILIAALDTAGIGLRIPAVAGILVAILVLGHVPGKRRLIRGDRIGTAGFQRLIDQIDRFILVDLGPRQGRMHHRFGIDILQHRDCHRRTRGLERGIVGIFAVGLQHQPDTFPVVRYGEGDLLCSLPGDRHELAGDIHLVRGDVGNAGIGRLVDELDLAGIAEQRLGDDMTHVDIEAL